MPAGSMPKESVRPDVKTKTDSSPDADDTDLDLSPDVQEGRTQDPDLDEDDLKEFETTKKVPYDRFKEVNDRMRTLERDLKEAKKDADSSLRKVISEYEVKLEALQGRRKDDDYVIDYDDDPKDKVIKELTGKLTSLEKTINSEIGMSRKERVRRELDSLQENYPEADQDAVLGWFKVYPEKSLKELMEKSHRDNNDRLEKK